LSQDIGCSWCSAVISAGKTGSLLHFGTRDHVDGGSNCLSIKTVFVLRANKWGRGDHICQLAHAGWLRFHTTSAGATFSASFSEQLSADLFASGHLSAQSGRRQRIAATDPNEHGYTMASRMAITGPAETTASTGSRRWSSSKVRLSAVAGNS